MTNCALRSDYDDGLSGLAITYCGWASTGFAEPGPAWPTCQACIDAIVDTEAPPSVEPRYCDACDDVIGPDQVFVRHGDMTICGPCYGPSPDFAGEF